MVQGGSSLLKMEGFGVNTMPKVVGDAASCFSGG